MATEQTVRIGHGLRQARLATGWTLHEVEVRSAGEFKASAVGAYERGERVLSALRLMRLAAMYGTDVDTILGSAIDIDLTREVAREQPVVERWDSVAVLAALARYSAFIRSVRRSPVEEPIRVRQADRTLLAVLFGADAEFVEQMLEGFGLGGTSSSLTPSLSS